MPGGVVATTMRITFRIHYLTVVGEELRVVLAGTEHVLEWIGGGWWGGDARSYRGAPYHYRLRKGTMVTDEPGPLRRAPAAAGDHVTVVDRWRGEDPARSSRESALFRSALAAGHPEPLEGPPRGLTVRVLAPEVPPGHRPGVVGSTETLGSWSPARAIALHPGPSPWWRVSTEHADSACEYKYVLLDEAGDVVLWEQGPNRSVPMVAEGPTVVTDDEIRGIPAWRGAGVGVPVFSLRTERSVGVGQFTDLVPFVDWAAAVGLTVVQLLPVNDSIKSHDWDDSYPYDVVSVRALHPMYVDLADVGVDAVAADVEAARAECDSQPEIAYLRVMEIKWSIMRKAYEYVADELDGDADFAEFVDREWEWLGPYSMWCVLRDTHLTAEHDAWGEDRRFDADRLDLMSAPGSEAHRELQFHWWVQHHLHRQLRVAADHARSRGVALKGDLPIGVSPRSVETWAHPQLFHLGAQAGAPPDAFAVRGQNWGFPTYDWEQMAKEGYGWWRARFAALARYVDVYRIDHVLGFFRIWEIPPDAVDGLLGRLRPCRPLHREEVASWLGDVDVSVLTRPAVDADLLAARFGRRADLVRERFFVGEDDDLRLAPGRDTQRLIVETIDGGALDGIPLDERPTIARTLLDIAADGLLLEAGDGYHPRISWAATEGYRRMPVESRARFDALAEDFFYRRHDDEWAAIGRDRLAAIVDATDMLACGEDLGMVPAMVPAVMNDLGMLSLEIERMPKVLGAWIADPADAPYLSVVSPGTHDTSPLREWWREDAATTARYWRNALGQAGEPPDEATPAIVEEIVARHLASPAMLAIVPLSDLLGMDAELRRTDGLSERINDPADRYHRWRYRMHLTVEELSAAATFNERLRSMVAASGRQPVTSFDVLR